MVRQKKRDEVETLLLYETGGQSIFHLQSHRRQFYFLFWLDTLIFSPLLPSKATCRHSDLCTPLRLNTSRPQDPPTPDCVRPECPKSKTVISQIFARLNSFSFYERHVTRRVPIIHSTRRSIDGKQSRVNHVEKGGDCEAVAATSNVMARLSQTAGRISS
jgi:hypothetical protein